MTATATYDLDTDPSYAQPAPNLHPTTHSAYKQPTLNTQPSECTARLHNTQAAPDMTRAMVEPPPITSHA